MSAVADDDQPYGRLRGGSWGLSLHLLHGQCGRRAVGGCLGLNLGGRPLDICGYSGYLCAFSFPSLHSPDPEGTPKLPTYKLGK